MWKKKNLPPLLPETSCLPLLLTLLFSFLPLHVRLPGDAFLKIIRRFYLIFTLSRFQPLVANQTVCSRSDQLETSNKSQTEWLRGCAHAHLQFFTGCFSNPVFFSLYFPQCLLTFPWDIPYSFKLNHESTSANRFLTNSGSAVESCLLFP